MSSFEEELQHLTDNRLKLANKYATERKAYGEAKAEIDILFASKILKLTEKKKNLGYETGLIMMMAEEGDEFRKLYKEVITRENNYKAIEKMIEAVESKIMTRQSIMRYYRENDGGI